MRTRLLQVSACTIATAALVAVTAASAATSGPPPPPKAPGGQTVQTVASGLSTPTAFAFGARKVFAADGGSEDGKTPGGVFLLSGGRATRLAGSPAQVFGLVWRKGTLYVSAGRAILAWSGWNGTTFTTQKTIFKIASNLFSGFNGLGFGADGRLYVGIDAGKYDHTTSSQAPYQGDFISMTASGQNVKVVASGIRQPWQMAFPKGSSSPFVSDLGQDAGAKNPPDFVLRITPGQNYGFPKCNWTKTSACTDDAKPFQQFSPHTDVMGLVILGGRLYMSEFGADAPKVSGAVASIPLTGGKQKTLLTGFAAPIVGLGTNHGYIYVGELTGQVFRVKP
jgi:glucose/arabinose dehydrogenase